MNYKTTGIITSISDVETLSNGALQLMYRIDNGQEHNPMMEFQVYKKAEHSEHMDKFVQYNKVGDKVDVDNFNIGDMVEVSFNLRGREWTSPQGEVRVFNTLDAWKITAINGGF